MTRLKAVLLLFLYLFAFSSVAKKYYKYTDDNGIVHYSDRAPKTEQPVESWQIKVDDAKLKINLRNRGSKNKPILYATNPYHGPVQVVLKFTSRENIIAEPELPLSVVVPALSDQHITSLEPLEKNRSWSYQYEVEFALGDPNAKHLDETVYQLPFEKHQKLYISQSFNGPFTHSGAQNEYAVDIAMPEGTPVLAARPGKVMDIADDFYKGGTNQKHLFRSNYIRVLHDDGSMAIYAHLKLESVQVAPGQRIKQGQKIALSGATGYASGPHLHFAVQVNNNLKLQSVPFRFKDKKGQVITPTVGPI